MHNYLLSDPLPLLLLLLLLLYLCLTYGFTAGCYGIEHHQVAVIRLAATELIHVPRQCLFFHVEVAVSSRIQQTI